MELDDNCKKFLVINTHRGLFRYNVLPQGIASSPAIFQEFMDKLLHDIPNANAYIDDAIIATPSKTEHLKTLKSVLQRMRDANFKLSKDKCDMVKSEITFLGHKLTADGLNTCDEKIAAITSIPPPKDISEVRSFMGFVIFYGKFYGVIHS